MNNIAYLVGRVLLSAIFIFSGISKIFDFAGTKGYMAAKGMPLPEVMLVGAIVVEVIGGLGLLIGLRVKYAAAVLFFFLIPTTIIFHLDFSVQSQVHHFLKNLAIMGGLAVVFSVDMNKK